MIVVLCAVAHNQVHDGSLTPLSGNHQNRALLRATSLGPVLAKGLSGIGNPPLVAALVFSALIWGASGAPGQAGTWIGISLFFCAALPTAYIWALFRLGRVESMFIPRRSRRLRPMLVASASYMVGLAFLLRSSAPRQVWVLMLCYVVNILLAMAITTRWQISVHAMGVWSPLAALTFLFGPSALWLVPVPVVVSWARIALGAHTLGQVAGGGTLAASCTWLLYKGLFDSLTTG